MKYAHVASALVITAQVALGQTPTKPVAVIGGDRGGRIELENPNDILTIGNRIVVLDANEPFLKVFDFDGKAIQATVKKGSGPGEISAARRFTADSATGRVYVIDVMNLRVRDILRSSGKHGGPLRCRNSSVHDGNVRRPSCARV
jgi:hypothetical protein